MAGESDKRRRDDKKRNPRAALDPLTTPAPDLGKSNGPSRMEVLSKAIFSPFSHSRTDSNRILSDLAPVIMTPRMMNAAATVQSKPRSAIESSSNSRVVDFATLGRGSMRLGLTRRLTSRDLQIVEATQELLDADIPEPQGAATSVSLFSGFNATIPSADKSRSRRRQTRNVDAPHLGLKRLGMNARGMLGDEDSAEHESVVSEEDAVLVTNGTARRKRRGRESLAAGKTLGREELNRQTNEILKDKDNIGIRRTLINNEIAEITHKIKTLDALRDKLEHNLLKLHEDELELDDELEGVKDRLEAEEASRHPPKATRPNSKNPLTQSSRRRKGPAFLPSEHDDLPPGVAFMTLSGHNSAINALDISEPYGTLVSVSKEESEARVWDLLSGEEIGRLRGHVGPIKCVQVEDHVALTGGTDGSIRLWDLRRLGEDEDEGWELGDVPEETESEAGFSAESSSGAARSEAGSTARRESGPCVRVLEGHSQAVTTMYFEDDCLVTGASDKTLRQWDLSTGQCVMTMDILWAISHPPTTATGASAVPGYMLPGASASVGTFSVPTPPYADGSWEMYQDFVGAVQSWGYALVSGSGDGVVRMWDMRTGQSHRTLLGHTGPVTCLQFDETHIISGSLDKTVRIWDLRTGSTCDSLQYDHAVTALQFDSRKIVVAAGENGVKLYNRTSMQQSSLLTNGHMKPVERLRYMDRYMVSGARDATVKVWAL